MKTNISKHFAVATLSQENPPSIRLSCFKGNCYVFSSFSVLYSYSLHVLYVVQRAN